MAAVRPDLLAVVEESPRAAAAHDRAGWVGLFTTDGQVEDPVGSRAHIGAEQLGRFYDTFIGPRDITFHRDLDVVHGSTVIRDLELEVGMGTTVTMRIPAVLRYDLRDADGQWKVARLRAYWELPEMMLRFLRHGPAAAPAAAGLTRALLVNQRLTGTAGFAAGFRRPGRRSKTAVSAFIAAIAAGDNSGAARLLSPTAAVTYGDDVAAEVARLGADLHGATVTKMVGAGRQVAVSVAARNRRGVLFAAPDRRTGAITDIRYFNGCA